MHHAPKTRRNSAADVIELVDSLGLRLDDWQQDALRAGLGEQPDGTWAVRQIGCSVPRQNGKTILIVVRALAGIVLFGEKLVIISAHRQDTARESFHRIVDLIESNPSLSARVEYIARAETREYIRFTDGREIRFKSRSTGAGRGFSCDCMLLDEAQILGAGAWSAILPTMSARPNPQAWLFGTPPTENDDAEVFSRIRALGIEAKEQRVAYIEYSADPKAPIDDEKTWAEPNPAYPARISYEAIAAELASMSEEQFRLERLGIWRDNDGHIEVIRPSVWRALISDGPSRDEAPAAIAVDMSHHLDISISAAWSLPGNKKHVETVWAGTDTAKAIEWIAGMAGRRIPVFVDDLSPAAQMMAALISRRVQVKKTTARDMQKACA